MLSPLSLPKAANLPSLDTGTYVLQHFSSSYQIPSSCDRLATILVNLLERMRNEQELVVLAPLEMPLGAIASVLLIVKHGFS